MVDFTKGQSIISIKDTVKKHKVLIPGLILVFDILGCDNVAMYYRIAKNKALNIAAKLELSVFGQEEATEDQSLSESRRFVAACHGAKNESSSKNRLL